MLGHSVLTSIIPLGAGGATISGIKTRGILGAKILLGTEPAESLPVRCSEGRFPAGYTSINFRPAARRAATHHWSLHQAR